MKGTLIRLDKTGHTKLAQWDTEVKDGPLDPAYAEQEFNRLVSQGHLAYGTTETGENVHLRAFEPETYPKILISRQLVGG